jgi:hypothetical protein
MRKLTAALALSAAVLTNQAHAQSAPEVTATTGVDYSSGDYGTGVDTNILVVPVSARIKTGNLRLTATMPWLRIDGSSGVVGDGNGGVIIDPTAPRTVRSGFGDLTLGAAYAIPEERLGLGLDISARVKVPTASRAKGLGTGKTDVTIGAELSKTFGKITPFASVGYRFLGDPVGLDLRDGWTASGGASVVFGRSSLILSYDFREASSAFSRDSQEVFGAFSTPLGQRLTLTTYGSAGLSDGAPDYGIGAMVGVRF